MTKGYSATLFGMKEHCNEVILEKNKDSYFGDLKTSANKMGDEIWNAIGDSLTRQSNLMEWIQACCKIMGNAGLPFTWTNGMGNVCTHNINKQSVKKITVNFNGKKIQFRVNKDKEELDVNKMVAACAANTTHSTDSAHLMMTEEICHENGIEDVWFVHDSFGAHYDDCDLLLECTKKAWVELHSRNILQEWWEEWTEMLMLAGSSCSVPHYTEFLDFGTLEATDCLDSDFFFG